MGREGKGSMPGIATAAGSWYNERSVVGNGRKRRLTLIWMSSLSVVMVVVVVLVGVVVVVTMDGLSSAVWRSATVAKRRRVR